MPDAARIVVQIDKPSAVDGNDESRDSEAKGPGLRAGYLRESSLPESESMLKVRILSSPCRATYMKSGIYA